MHAQTKQQELVRELDKKKYTPYALNLRGGKNGNVEHSF